MTTTNNKGEFMNFQLSKHTFENQAKLDNFMEFLRRLAKINKSTTYHYKITGLKLEVIAEKK